MIDTNILIAALIKDSKTRHLILHPQLDLCCVEELIQEPTKYKDYIMKKAKISEERFNDIFMILLENITVIPYEKLKSCEEQALKLIGSKDMKDIPFLSLALCIKVQGIWSNDIHFKDIKEIKRYTTKEIIDIVE